MRLVNLDDLVLIGPVPNGSGRWQAIGDMAKTAERDGSNVIGPFDAGYPCPEVTDRRPSLPGGQTA